jgi:hypothetical protein
MTISPLVQLGGPAAGAVVHTQEVVNHEVYVPEPEVQVEYPKNGINVKKIIARSNIL